MYTHVCIDLSLYIYIYTYIHTYKHTNIQTNKQTNKQTYIHTYIHTYMHTHTHIWACADIPFNYINVSLHRGMHRVCIGVPIKWSPCLSNWVRGVWAHALGTGTRAAAFLTPAGRIDRDDVPNTLGLSRGRGMHRGMQRGMHLGMHRSMHRGCASRVCIRVCIGGMHRGYASDTHELMNLSVKLSKGYFGARP